MEGLLEKPRRCKDVKNDREAVKKVIEEEVGRLFASQTVGASGL